MWIYAKIFDIISVDEVKEILSRMWENKIQYGHYYHYYSLYMTNRGSFGRDRMVVRFTITYATSSYHY